MEERVSLPWEICFFFTEAEVRESAKARERKQKSAEAIVAKKPL